MAGLRLTRGGESRLDGAPYQDLPDYAAYVNAVAARLLEDDTDGLLANDQELARERAKEIVNAQLDAERKKRSDAQARVADDYGRRQHDRAQARGVDPEAMPYGASASDVRLANRPVAEASAQLAAEQDAADRIVRGLREGAPTFEAQGDLDFLRERGDMNPLAGPGKTDMAMRGAIRERRGQYYEMPDGTRIPVGREPTAADIRAEREWQDWVNSQPGSERQALYDPVAYEQHREEVRQRIQDNARREMAMYGTGSDAALMDAAEAGNRDAQDQLERRKARAASDDRQAEATREVRINQLARRAGVTVAAARQMMDKGRVSARNPAQGGAAAPLTAAQRRVESQELRDLGSTRRNQELAARKQARIDQAMLAGGQPTGGPFGTRATTTAINQLGPGWREIALLDRLTNGRVGGPTPLGVDAMGAQNAFRMMQGMELGQGFLNNPAVQQQVQNAQLQQQANVLADAENHVNDNYAWDRGWMGSSSFTAAEQQQTINYLMNKYGPPAGRMTLAQAQAIVDDIAARKIKEPAAPPAVPDAGGPPMM